MTTLPPEWDQVHEARLAAADVACLAPLRDRADIRVRLEGDVVWVTWSSSHAEVLPLLMPIDSVVFYQHTHGIRSRFGSRLPTSDPAPSGAERSLSHILSPALATPVLPNVMPSVGFPVRLVRSDVPQPTTALMCPLSALQPFADTATTVELARIRGLLSGEHAFLFGERLPSIAGAIRFYGHDVLLPVGFQMDPDWPAAVLRAATGCKPRETVWFTESEYGLIAMSAAEPLTRAGIRLALAGVSS